MTDNRNSYEIEEGEVLPPEKTFKKKAKKAHKSKKRGDSSSSDGSDSESPKSPDQEGGPSNIPFNPATFPPNGRFPYQNPRFPKTRKFIHKFPYAGPGNFRTFNNSGPPINRENFDQNKGGIEIEENQNQQPPLQLENDLPNFQFFKPNRPPNPYRAPMNRGGFFNAGNGGPEGNFRRNPPRGFPDMNRVHPGYRPQNLNMNPNNNRYPNLLQQLTPNLGLAGAANPLMNSLSHEPMNDSKVPTIGNTPNFNFPMFSNPPLSHSNPNNAVFNKNSNALFALSPNQNPNQKLPSSNNTFNPNETNLAIANPTIINQPNNIPNTNAPLPNRPNPGIINPNNLPQSSQNPSIFNPNIGNMNLQMQNQPQTQVVSNSDNNMTKNTEPERNNSKESPAKKADEKLVETHKILSKLTDISTDQKEDLLKKIRLFQQNSSQTENKETISKLIKIISNKTAEKPPEKEKEKEKDPLEEKKQKLNEKMQTMGIFIGKPAEEKKDKPKDLKDKLPHSETGEIKNVTNRAFQSKDPRLREKPKE